MTIKQTILITGATAGIGRRVAIDLAKAGHRVVASGRRTAALEALAAELSGYDLYTIRLDVTDNESITAARAAVDGLTDGAGLDTLINNAGYGQAGPTEMISDADMRAQYDTNVFGLMAVTRAFVPAMRARGRGRIINVSSVGGRLTMPLMGVYNSTKYAVESLSDALRYELAAFGIDVVLIEPGMVRTGFSGTSMKSAATYVQPNSPYSRVMERFTALEAMLSRTAVGPDHISRVVQRAVHARRPRARYMAPCSGAVMFAVLSVLPTRWGDWAVRKITGLTRRGLGLTALPVRGA